MGGRTGLGTLVPSILRAVSHFNSHKPQKRFSMRLRSQMIPVGLFLPVVRAKRPDKRARTLVAIAWAAGNELLHNTSQLCTGLSVAYSSQRLRPLPAGHMHAWRKTNLYFLPLGLMWRSLRAWPHRPEAKAPAPEKAAVPQLPAVGTRPSSFLQTDQTPSLDPAVRAAPRE